MQVAPHHSTHAPRGKFNGKLETFSTGATSGVWRGSVAVLTEQQMTDKDASCAKLASYERNYICFIPSRSRVNGTRHFPQFRHPFRTEGYINCPQAPGRDIRMSCEVLRYCESFWSYELLILFQYLYVPLYTCVKYQKSGLHPLKKTSA